VTLTAGRTVATVVLGAVGLMALAMVARPANPLRRAVVAGTVLGFVLVFLVPQARAFFALEIPRPVVALAAIGVVAITGALLRLGLDAFGWVGQLTGDDGSLPDPVDLLQRLRRRVAGTGRPPDEPNG
jgi:cation-transporting ATPase E